MHELVCFEYDRGYCLMIFERRQYYVVIESSDDRGLAHQRLGAHCTEMVSALNEETRRLEQKPSA